MPRKTPVAFTDLIARLREEAGLSPDDMTSRLGLRSKSVIYRLENGEQEPDVKTINTMISEYRTSAEELLRALGVNLNPPEASRLPRDLVRELLKMDQQGWNSLLWLLRRGAAEGSETAGKAP